MKKIISIVLLVVSSAYAQDGTVNLSYGGNNTGISLIAIPNQTLGRVSSKSLFIDSMQRQYMAITGSLSNVNSSYIARLNPNGTLDSSFNAAGPNPGFVAVTGPLLPNPAIAQLIVQPDRKIVIVGQVDATPGRPTIFTTRYNEDGTPDMSFNGGAPLVDPNFAFATGVALDVNGAVTVVGTDSPNLNIIIIRYTALGVLDTTFNGTGEVILHIPNLATTGSITIDTENNITVSGLIGTFVPTMIGQLLLVQFLPNGSLNTAFSNGGPNPGIVINADTDIDIFAPAPSHVLQKDGSIVAALTDAAGTTRVYRYLSTGMLDNSFNGTGSLTTPFSNTIATGVLLQGDEKILVYGVDGSENVTYYQFVIRITSAGAIDTTFGTAGIVTSTFGQSVIHRTSRSVAALSPNGFITGSVSLFDSTNNVDLAATQFEVATPLAKTAFLPHNTNITGSAQGKSIVELFFNGTELCFSQCPTGTWTCSGITDPAQELLAVAHYASGNVNIAGGIACTAPTNPSVFTTALVQKYCPC